MPSEVVFNFPLAEPAKSPEAGPVAQSHAGQMRRMYQAAACDAFVLWGLGGAKAGQEPTYNRMIADFMIRARPRLAVS